MAPRERGCNQTLCYGKYTFVLYLHSLSFYTYIFVVGPLSKLAYTVHISSAEGYTKYDFCILCGINSKHSDILKKKGGYRAAQTENAKSMSYQGLSQRGINERSVCIRGRSAKQHGHDGQNAMSSRVHHGL